jgi:small subunit ribosomal protein S1
VKFRVLEVDVAKERINLGIKQMQTDPFVAAVEGIKRGAVVTCTITQVTDGGLKVKVNDGATGFIRKAELSRERSEQRPERFAVGEKIDAKVISVDEATRNMQLSVKQREIEEDKQAMEQFGSSDSGASLGDVLGAALKRADRK